MICIQHRSTTEGGSLILPASRITTEAQFCPPGKDGKIINDEEGHTRRIKLIETVMIINTVVPQRRSITYYYFSKIDLYLVRINPIRLDPKSCPSVLTFSSKAF